MATDFTGSTLSMFPVSLLGNSKHTAVFDIRMGAEEDDDALGFLIILIKCALNYSIIHHDHLDKNNNNRQCCHAKSYPKATVFIISKFMVRRPNLSTRDA